jgi:hypothetical protein
LIRVQRAKVPVAVARLARPFGDHPHAARSHALRLGHANVTMSLPVQSTRRARRRVLSSLDEGIDMTKHSDSNLSPAERVHDIPRIIEALRLAVQEALLDHKRAGNPVAIWKDGRVEWVQPEDIPVSIPAQGWDE